MSGVNKCIIIGRLGQDPEIKYLPSGVAVANFSVATSEKWKDKTTGDTVEKTEWHRMTAFARTAEIIGQYLKKGSNAYFEGSIHTRKYTDNNGVEKYTTEIKVNNMQMLDGKGDNGGQQQSPAQQRAQGAANPQGSNQGQAPAPAAEDFDDQIPF